MSDFAKYSKTYIIQWYLWMVWCFIFRSFYDTNRRTILDLYYQRAVHGWEDGYNYTFHLRNPTGRCYLSTNWLVDGWLTIWLITWLTTWLVGGWPSGWSPGWPLGWLVADHMAGWWLTTWLVGGWPPGWLVADHWAGWWLTTWLLGGWPLGWLVADHLAGWWLTTWLFGGWPPGWLVADHLAIWWLTTWLVGGWPPGWLVASYWLADQLINMFNNAILCTTIIISWIKFICESCKIYLHMKMSKFNN